MTDERPTWNKYFLDMAVAAAGRADCRRRKVGAILVDKNRRIRGAGYNGGRPGGPSCLAGECPRGLSNVVPGSSYDTGAGSCVALHAEQNLYLYTSPEEREGGSVFITDEPCGGCLRMMQGSNISQIAWPAGVWIRTDRHDWTLFGPDFSLLQIEAR